MFDLIPSSEVREYLKSINYQLTDFQKATLLWNTRYKSLEEQLHKLTKMILATDDINLKLQLGKRYVYEQESVDKFKTQTENCIFVVCNEDDCGCDTFRYMKRHFTIARKTVIGKFESIF